MRDGGMGQARGRELRISSWSLLPCLCFMPSPWLSEALAVIVNLVEECDGGDAMKSS